MTLLKLHLFNVMLIRVVNRLISNHDNKKKATVMQNSIFLAFIFFQIIKALVNVEIIFKGHNITCENYEVHVV